MDNSIQNKRNKFFDIYQMIIAGFIGATFIFFIVSIILRFIFLDDLATREIIDSITSINSALHILSWTWFIIRSVTYSMRLNEAMKEQEDI